MIEMRPFVENGCLMAVNATGCPSRSGKVREILDLGEQLLIVTTDRISAYDVVMPNGIPDKGRVLTQITAFWLELLKDLTPNHLLSVALADLPEGCRSEELEGRFMLCRKCRVVPIECIVRGYLAGSGWKEYKQNRTACGIPLPEDLKQCSELPEPIFTPSTKAEKGHDENITFDQTCEIVGRDVATQIRDKSLAVYNRGRAYAADRGIILADTKFEWGWDAGGQLMLIDEVLTPDSSRFWPADTYEPGRDQTSFDKQFLRDWLDAVNFNRTPPGPVLPTDIVQKTRAKYVEAFTRLTGREFPWQ